MAVLERKIKIEWKLNPNYYTLVNSKHINMDVQRIGSAKGAVNRMLTNDEMMRTLMPPILGIDPTSATNNWSKELADYWHSLSQEVPEQGLTLDISLKFDIKDGHNVRKKYIQALLAENKDIKTSEDMMEALTDKKSKHYVSEEELYRYAEPLSTYDYLLWYYCKGYRAVSNDLTTVRKSNNILFYMVDEGIKKAAKVTKSKRMIEATNKYVELSKDIESLKAVYSILKPNDAKNIYKMSEDDLIIEVHSTLMSSPDTIIKLADDKNLKLKGQIEQMIASGVLKRIPTSNTVVDAIDQTRVLGYSTDEVVVFMKSEEPDIKKYVNELKLRLKNTLNK